MSRRVSILILLVAGAGCQPVATSSPNIEWSLTRGSPAAGIEGLIAAGEAELTFQSSRRGEVVEASVRDGEGRVLYAYREFGAERVSVPAGAEVVSLQRMPSLMIDGVAHDAPQFKAALERVGRGPYGALFRELGLGLVHKARGAALTPERRGLELATQALWPFLAEVPAQGYTEDYEIAAAGYLVRTQPEDLVLASNYARVAMRPYHNDDEVNGCFGRCGAGCTGGFLGMFWEDEWRDVYGTEFGYQEETRCESGWQVHYRWYATPTTHSVNGWWTPGCQLHDNCCRELGWLGCGTVCNVLAPVAPLSDPLGEGRTWSYTDYSWRITVEQQGYTGCICPDEPGTDDYECVGGVMPAVCGNGVCESGETCSGCSGDCGSCTPPGGDGYCGDGICSTGESWSGCSDCNLCESGECYDECRDGDC